MLIKLVHNVQCLCRKSALIIIMILIQMPSKGQYGSNPVKGRPYQQFRLNESWVFALFLLAPPSLSLSPANSNQALTCQRVNPLSNYKSCYYHSCNWQSHSRQSRILLPIVIQFFFFLSSIHLSLGAVYRVKHSPRCFLPPPPPRLRHWLSLLQTLNSMAWSTTLQLHNTYSSTLQNDCPGRRPDPHLPS